MGKNNWLLQYLKFGSSVSETGGGKDFSHSVGSCWGVGTDPVWGSWLWGWHNSRDLLSIPDMRKNYGCFWGREGSGRPTVAVTVHQPTYRNSKSHSLSLSKSSDRHLCQPKPFPNLPYRGRRNGWPLSASFSRGQNSALCTLLRGIVQIST